MKLPVPSQAFLDFVASRLPAGQILDEPARRTLNAGRDWKQLRPQAGGMLRMCSVVCPSGGGIVRIGLLNVSAHDGDLITIPHQCLPSQEQVMEVAGQGELHVYHGVTQLFTHRHDLKREFHFVPGQVLRAEHGVVLAFEL